MALLATAAEKAAALDAVTGTYRDVARVMSCSEKHVARMVRDGKIPGVIRQGRMVRFHMPSVVRWVESRAGVTTTAR